jgi:hypothetical protein
MIKSQEREKYAIKILKVLSIILATFIIAFLTFNLGFVFAVQTDNINATQIVSAPIEKVVY